MVFAKLLSYEQPLLATSPFCQQESQRKALRCFKTKMSLFFVFGQERSLWQVYGAAFAFFIVRKQRQRL